MKKTKLLFAIILLCSFFGNAQKLNVIKGNTVLTFDVNTEIDSIIFYNPNFVVPVSDAPYYDLTGKVFKQKDYVVPASGNFDSDWGGGTPKQYAYESVAAGGLVGLDVIFPPSYDANNPTKRFPVIYHLHGAGEVHTAYRYNGFLDVKLPEWWNNKSINEFIFVSIGGPKTCWWSDGNDGVNAESHIINEVLSVVDQKFNTLAKRSTRAITGFSMGGFGASKIAMKYPQYFAVSGMFCGASYDKYPSSYTLQDFTNTTDATRIWVNWSNYNTNDCARALLPSKAANIKPTGAYPVSFVITAGIGDTKFYVMNKTFRDELQAQGLPVSYSESPGGHMMSTSDGTTIYVTPEYFTSILAGLTLQ